MSYQEIQACRVCGNKELVEVLTLGNQALTGVFLAREDQPITVGPLSLVKCHGQGDICHLLQLQHTYASQELYSDHYGYRSGLNSSMVQHLESKVRNILQLVSLEPGDLIIDIGSNDGTTLGFYPQGDWDLVGVDPTGGKFSQYYEQHVNLITDFFSGQIIREKMGQRKAKVISSFSMFYDLPQPVVFAEEIADLLSSEGVWVLE